MLDDWAVRATAMRFRDAACKADATADHLEGAAARMQATEDAIGNGLGRIGEGL